MGNKSHGRMDGNEDSEFEARSQDSSRVIAAQQRAVGDVPPPGMTEHHSSHGTRPGMLSEFLRHLLTSTRFTLIDIIIVVGAFSTVTTKPWSDQGVFVHILLTHISVIIKVVALWRIIMGIVGIFRGVACTIVSVSKWF